MNVSEIIVGDTLQFDTSVPDYPASLGYTLTYRLVPRVSGAAIEITASADGDDFTVNVSAATTAAWTAGEYSWHSYVTLTGARYTVGQGQITLKPNPASMTAQDTRSHAQKMLAAIEALLEGRSSSDIESYTIHSRSITKMSVAELVKWRSFYQQQVRSEIAAASLDNGVAPGGKWLARL